MPTQIDVHIGEIKIAKNGEILKSILGSCVGIAFIWKKKSICGLAHCLLAEAPSKTFAIGGRFVDQAIPSLIALMKIHPEDIPDIEVIVLGGGNMTQPGAKKTDQLVGTKNFSVAIRELQKRGIIPALVDQANEEGRKITINSADGSYEIETIAKIVEAA